MSTVTLAPGALFEKDANEQRVVVFDWDAALGTNVTIVTSTWTITAIRPSADTGLTKDNDSILSGSRSTQVRVKAGTLGAEYQLTNQIVTNESPAQTKEKSCRVKVADL